MDSSILQSNYFLYSSIILGVFLFFFFIWRLTKGSVEALEDTQYYINVLNAKVDALIVLIKELKK